MRVNLLVVIQHHDYVEAVTHKHSFCLFVLAGISMILNIAPKRSMMYGSRKDSSEVSCHRGPSGSRYKDSRTQGEFSILSDISGAKFVDGVSKEKLIILQGLCKSVS